jgi:hypothetical protein
MNEQLMAGIRERMAAKSTEELHHIYDTHDEAQWTPEAFEAIRQLLSERGEPVPTYQDPNVNLTGSVIGARRPRRWLRWVMVGIFALFIMGLINHFISFPIANAKSNLRKGDALAAQGHLADAARSYAKVMVQYPGFTKEAQHEASRRILTLFASMKPEDAPAVRDALDAVLSYNKLGSLPLIERSDSTSLLLYFDNGLDRPVDIFIDGRQAESVPAKGLHKYAYHVNGPLRIETREAGQLKVIESFETQFTPGGTPCLAVIGCKDVFISGGVPPAQYIYNIGRKNSYKLWFHYYGAYEVPLFPIGWPNPDRLDNNLGDARLFLVPLGVSYMLDEPVPANIEIPQHTKGEGRVSLARR